MAVLSGSPVKMFRDAGRSEKFFARPHPLALRKFDARMNPDFFIRTPRPAALWSRVFGWLVLVICLLGAARSHAADLVMTESEVKALCLLNFTKYVTWPEAAFPAGDSSLRIGVINHGQLADNLEKVSKGKVIAGHQIQILELKPDGDWSKCQILFVGADAKSEFAEILSKAGKRPILTVGERDGFLEAGGVINFVKKDNKVRFEVDLDAAHQTGLQISSKLLSLADAVRGKQ